MTNLLKKLAANRKGATAIEYGLIAAFIALALTVALPGINSSLKTTFGKVDSELKAAAPAS